MADAIDKQLEGTYNIIVPLHEKVVVKGKNITDELIGRGKNVTDDLINRGRNVTDDLIVRGKNITDDLVSRGHMVAGNVIEKGKELRENVMEKGRELTLYKRFELLSENFLGQLEQQLATLERAIEAKYGKDL